MSIVTVKYVLLAVRGNSHDDQSTDQDRHTCWEVIHADLAGKIECSSIGGSEVYAAGCYFTKGISINGQGGPSSDYTQISRRYCED